jgi:glycosyltransferase involved in cell wall biosynthesis
VKVSVCMITYNHERFIAQAIESVTEQQADFDFELVIGEDCSTDRTREICRYYQQKRPRQIRLLEREHNLGMLRNFTRSLSECNGEYIALLEGDDYWTDVHKLQRQACFLDEHSDHAACFGRTQAVREGATQPAFEIPAPRHRKPTLDIEDLLRSNRIATCSVMFRRACLSEFPEWYYTLLMGDWPLHIMNAARGKIGYLDEDVAVYRLHSAGSYSTRDLRTKLQGDIDFYTLIDKFLDFKYHALIEEQIAGIRSRIARLPRNLHWAQIKRLDVAIGPQEAALHEAVEGDALEASPENVKAFHRWLMKLREANRYRPVFAEPAFSQDLGRIWWSFVRCAERPNWFLARSFVFSPLLRHMPLTWRDRFSVLRRLILGAPAKSE